MLPERVASPPPSAGPPALPLRAAALLVALTALLLLFRLGAVPLVGPDEPRYARVAVEMHRSGDWVTPTLQGRPWLEKPALYYWLASTAYAALGETEAAARLPSVLADLLLVGAVALLGARLYGAGAGLHAGFVAATSLLVFAYGRAASMDMLLAAAVTASIGLFALRALGIAGRSAIPAGYLFMAVGALAKGPIGVLLPMLVVLAHLLLARDRKLVRDLASPTGIALFLLIALPWYWLVWRAQGRTFVEVFLLEHNLHRFTTTVHHHPGSPLYYLPVIAVGLFPWTGLIVPGLSALHPATDRRDRFLLLWLVLPLVFFSLAGSKLPGYVLPCLPPLALLMGRAADEAVRGVRQPVAWRSAALVGLALGAVAVSMPLVLRSQGEPTWILIVPAGVWALFVAFAVSRTLARDVSAALRLLRVGASGFLLLLAMAAPRVLASRESGRNLFLPAAGREVLAWGAWRTAWMAGYFYNDGRVREVADVREIMDAAGSGPVLVLCGAGERRRLERTAAVATLVLAEGPRGNSLMRVRQR